MYTRAKKGYDMGKTLWEHMCSLAQQVWNLLCLLIWVGLGVAFLMVDSGLDKTGDPW